MLEGGRLHRVALADVKDLRKLRNRARVLRFSKPAPGLGWQAAAMGERTKRFWVMERPCPQKIMGDRTSLSTGMGDITMRRTHLVRPRIAVSEKSLASRAPHMGDVTTFRRLGAATWPPTEFLCVRCLSCVCRAQPPKPTPVEDGLVAVLIKH